MRSVTGANLKRSNQFKSQRSKGGHSGAAVRERPTGRGPGAIRRAQAVSEKAVFGFEAGDSV